MANHLIPGAERPAVPPETVRRLWLQRRVRASSQAVDALIVMALGELQPDAIDWPTPTWAGPVREVAHA